MYITSQSRKRQDIDHKATIDLGFDWSTNKSNHEEVINIKSFKSYLQKHQSGHGNNDSDAHWMCIASDYSVQYKKMHNRYNPLYKNDLSIGLHSLSTVGNCKVADITRCSYVMQEGQCIRVSVHATLVFMQ